MSSDASISPLRHDSFSKSYYMIARLGFGSFGCAVLAKYRGHIATLLAPKPHKAGTLMEPLEHNKNSQLHGNGLVAIKVMKNQLKHPRDYLRVNEIKFILSVTSHTNLLQVYDLFIDSSSGKLNIVMEPMNENLYQFIQKHESRPIASWVVKSMLAQLLGAIRHIHSHGYFHRDVKPENILVTATKSYFGKSVPPDRRKDMYVLKLCDYGLSRHISNTKDLTQYVSTRWYRAPEILLRHQEYSRPIDIWAFGSVAVELVNRRPLFPGTNESDQIWHILNKLGHPLYSDRSPDDVGGVWSEGVHLAERLGFIIPYIGGQTIHNILGAEYTELADTIQSCLMWDPKQRCTAETLSRKGYFAGTALDESPRKMSVPSSPKRLRSLGLNRNLPMPAKPKFKPRLFDEAHDFTVCPSPSSADLATSPEMPPALTGLNFQRDYFGESSSSLALDQRAHLQPQHDEGGSQVDTSFGSHEIQC